MFYYLKLRTSLTFQHSFLASRKYVDIAAEEYSLTKICLGFLTLPSLKDGILESEVKHFLSRGYYSFLDYAVCYWDDHIKEWVQLTEQTRPNVIIDNSLRSFLRSFWSKIEQPLPIPTDLRTMFSAFKSCDYFESLLQAVQIWKRIRTLLDVQPAEMVSPDLLERIAYVRRILENSSSSPLDSVPLKGQISSIYGHNLFKCPWIGCSLFSVGFPTKLLRDQHMNIHHRSFSCDVDGCIENSNFDTQQDLERHIEEAHGTNTPFPGRNAETVSLSGFSIVSSAPSIFSSVSTSTFPSRYSEGVLWLASEQFVALLVNDEMLGPLFHIAMESKTIGPDRFARNFRRILKVFARDLKIEAQGPLQTLTANFLKSQAADISQSIRKKYDFEHQIVASVARRSSQGMEELHAEQVEKFLQDQVSRWASQTSDEISEATPQTMDLGVSETSPTHVLESDAEDFSSSDDDDEPQERENLRSIEQVRQFVIDSYAFSKLCRSFKEFVQPSLANEEAGHKKTLKYNQYWDNFCSWLRRVLRGPLQSGYQRITWTCVSNVKYLFSRYCGSDCF
jgi:hypothetical protein